MKNYILMTLATATALSPVAAYAAPVAPVRADVMVEDYTDFQREERRAERQEARANRTPEQRAERRAERPQNRPERAQSLQEPTPAAEVINRAERQRDNVRVERAADAVRTERQRDNVRVERAADAVRVERAADTIRTERREARQDGRYYDRNRDGELDRRWDRNRDGNLDRNWDRNRDGRLDRRLDRNDDERIDRRYDQNRDGRLDRTQDGRWTKYWRNDNRYNWRGYREQNRNYYRPGRYFAPYRGRNYSRISVGFSLGSGYYGSRYWINDPWRYRLPAAYGSYRWVRYYDDVLLVDLRNGRVVDVIRSFFW
jgi:hypothetical protein